MHASLYVLKPILTKTDLKHKKGRIIIGTVAGDLHDLGKNMVSMIFQGDGYEVIDLGIDVLNPVQVTAKDMDTKKLKSEFGKDITFWGGGADPINILNIGTPDQVTDEVRRRIDDMAPGGGFVFTTVHNIQADVPPQNIVAMYEALRKYGDYK